MKCPKCNGKMKYYEGAVVTIPVYECEDCGSDMSLRYLIKLASQRGKVIEDIKEALRKCQFMCDTIDQHTGTVEIIQQEALIEIKDIIKSQGE